MTNDSLKCLGSGRNGGITGAQLVSGTWPPDYYGGRVRCCCCDAYLEIASTIHTNKDRITKIPDHAPEWTKT